MARNMPLPQVEIEGDAPYVIASTYPNGPVCVATEGRVKPEDQWYHPRAKVTIHISDMTQPIGVFGHYDALVLEFNQSVEGVENIWAQDLMADEAINIKSKVSVQGNTISIPGALIDKIGTSAGDEGDISVPGLVIKIKI